MATLKTEITEIVTGLAMLGYRELDHALGVRPRMVSSVSEAHFDRLIEARAQGQHQNEFETAWLNGQRFAFADEGLRGRSPWWIEWKGPHKPPAYEQIPADLRVDHVYLVSCKYGSNILMNASPAYLFDRLLASGHGERSADWYLAVTPEAVGQLWAACRNAVDTPLPDSPEDLSPEDRKRLKRAFAPWKGGRWPSEEAAEAYRWMAADVSDRSAKRWLAALAQQASRKEEMVWRLLRFAASPYFVLGSSVDGTPLHYRVATPWDFRQRFTLRSFDAWGDAVGQPVVRWRAEVTERDGAGNRGEHDNRVIEGHVEVRWSHGKFGGAPEAKIYLDTPHHNVPGYFPLTLPT